MALHDMTVGSTPGWWVEMIFASLEEGRLTHGSEAFETPNLLSDGRPVEIGLLDIPVTFKGGFR